MTRTRTSFCCASLLLAPLALAAPQAASAAPPPPESPVSVSMQMRAPFIGSSSNGLWGVETDGRYPFSKDFAIPYAQLEDEIDRLIDESLPNNVYGTEVCDDPCPDVEWRVQLNPKFKFTKKGQPKLTQIGASGKSKVRVELATEARLDLHADVTAETWLDTVEVPVDVFIVVGMKASVDISLWPDLEAKQPGSSKSGVKLEFELVDTDLDFDLNGTGIELGFKWGTIIGFTPLGLLAGGPILGPVLALFGDAAADMAEAKINEEFEKHVQTMFTEQTKNLQKIVNDHIDPYLTQANDLKDEMLDTPIPGVGKTLDQVKSDLGAEIQLHTVAATSSVSSAAILRMSGAAAGGKMFGKVRVPKEVCEYASFSVGGVSGTLPLGLAPANEDLDAKVGQNCSAALTQKFGRKLFHGANPRAVLGASAENLTTWSTSAGSLAYTGKVRETGDWYECDFEVTGLPKIAILQLTTSQLAERGIYIENRFMSVLTGGKSRVFNDAMAPLPEGTGGNSSLVIGGKGVCGGGSSGGGLTPNKMKALKDSLDADKCPTCGLARRPGSWVYEPADMKAMISTPVMKGIIQQMKQNKAKVKSRAARPAGQQAGRANAGRAQPRGAQPGRAQGGANAGAKPGAVNPAAGQ